MKVYADQKAQFESQEVFRRLNRETEIKCIDYRELTGTERQSKIIDRAKCSGHLDIAFVCNGTHLRLHFFHWRSSIASSGPTREYIDFEKEPGRMHFKSPVIYNGVCVYCLGYINLTKFDGVAKLEFDAQFAQYESDRSGGGVIVNNRESKGDAATTRGSTSNSSQHPTYSQNVSTIVPNVKFEPTAPSPASSQ